MTAIIRSSESFPAACETAKGTKVTKKRNRNQNLNRRSTRPNRHRYSLFNNTSASSSADESQKFEDGHFDLQAAPSASNSATSTTTLPTPPPTNQTTPVVSAAVPVVFPSSTALEPGLSFVNMQEADGQEPTITAAMPANATESVSKDVAPFLTKHIPGQYAQAPQDEVTKGNTRYCYRHRPDIKCRRQADELTMDSLQKKLETLPSDDQQAITHVWNLFSAAPATHRNIMLQGILTQCCFPQLSFISNALRDLIRIDFLSALPPELAFKILCYLDTTSLCKAAQVSQRWRMLADDDVVWHKMCEQHIDRKCDKCGWGLPLLERKRLRATKRQIQLRARGMSSEMVEAMHGTSKLNIHGKRAGVENGASTYDVLGSPAKRPCTRPSEFDENEEGDSYFNQPKRRPWKDVYSERYKVESNWRRGRCTTKIFKGHTNGIICLQFDDNILATGSYDATIKIWDIETAEEIRTLSGHTLGVRALQFDDRMLISGSMDNTLKIWNYRTGVCLSTLPGHTAGVISLHFDSTLLVSGSVDMTIRVWNFEDKSCFTLRGHTDWVNSVKIHTASRTIFSASDDMTVKIWDLDTRSCIHTFTGHVGQVQQVLPILFSGWENVFKETEQKKDEGKEGEVSPIGSPSYMASPPHMSSPPYYPSHFIPTSPRSPPTQAASSFSSLCAGLTRTSPIPKFMLTAALDSTVKLWDTTTGQCVRTLFGHVEGVWALCADTLRVVSGAQDRMVKVWDVKTGKCDRTITGHAAAVTCLALSDSRLVTGSEDCEARMYCFKSVPQRELPAYDSTSPDGTCAGFERRRGTPPDCVGEGGGGIVVDGDGSVEGL